MPHRDRSSLLLTLSLFLYGVSYWSFSPVDPDLGWHLLGGAWSSKTGAPPHTDFINVFGTHWHDYHWLAQTVMFKVYTWSGFPGLMIGLGLVIATLAVLLGRVATISVPHSAKLVPPITPIIASLLAIGSVTSHRPQLLALLLLIVGQLILLSKLDRLIEVALFLLLTAICANLHVYWVFLPLLWCFYRVGTTYRREGLPSVLMKLGAITAGGLLSPYGILAPLVGWELTLNTALNNYTVLLDYLFLPPSLAAQISEFRSSLADPGVPRWVLIGSIIVVARWGGRWLLKSRSGDLWAYLAGLLLAISKVKFIAIFGVLALPLHIRVVLHISQEFPGVRALFIRYLKPALLVSTTILSVHAVSTFPTFTYQVDDLSTMYPIRGCREIATMSTQATSVTVLTSFDHGGWCRWALAQQAPSLDSRVFVDGRTQGRDEAYFKAVFDLFTMRGAWLKTLHAWNPDYAVLGKDTPLAQFMALAPNQWQLLSQDDNFALFRAVKSRP
jgi:hypothetical protein